MRCQQLNERDSWRHICATEKLVCQSNCNWKSAHKNANYILYELRLVLCLRRYCSIITWPDILFTRLTTYRQMPQPPYTLFGSIKHIWRKLNETDPSLCFTDLRKRGPDSFPVSFALKYTGKQLSTPVETCRFFPCEFIHVYVLKIILFIYVFHLISTRISCFHRHIGCILILEITNIKASG